MKYCIFLIALLLSYTSNLAQIPQPVGLYPFQENANDYSTKQNHGINVGALPCEDRFGNERAAFYFDGKSSVIIPDAPHLRSEEMIIIFWYQVEHQNPQPILFKGNIVNQNDFNYSIRVGPGEIEGRIQHGSDCINTDIREGGTAISEHNDCWTQFAFTFTKLGFSFYENGFKIYEGYGTSRDEFCEGESLSIANGGFPTNNFFEGKIDDLRIFDTVLSNEEILLIYNNEAPEQTNCEADFDCMILATDELLNESMVNISPIPTQGIINLKFSSFLPERIKVFNLNGKLKASYIYTNQSYLDLHGLPKGIYMIVFEDKESSISKRVVIK